MGRARGAATAGGQCRSIERMRDERGSYRAQGAQALQAKLEAAAMLRRWAGASGALSTTCLLGA